jgi:hypothetical protein
LLALLFGQAHTASGQEIEQVVLLPSLGMRVGQVTDDISKAFGLPGPYGAIVYSVDVTGPAIHADIRPGDLITKLNDKSVQEYREFAQLVNSAPTNAHLKLTTMHLGMEQVKTVNTRVPETSAIRTPACEEFASIPYSMTAFQILFGKTDLNVAELDEAHTITMHCLDLDRHNPTSAMMRVRALLPTRLAWIRDKLEKAKQTWLDGEQRALVRDQTIFKSRLAEEMKNTEAKIKADECRKQCPQKLLAMLNELRSLVANAAGINQIRELDHKHQALVMQMPPDVFASVRELNDIFVAEYGTAEAKALGAPLL